LTDGLAEVVLDIGACLRIANFQSHLYEVPNLTHLSGADLSGAVRTAKLDGQKQLDRACGNDAKLPVGLTLRPCPPGKPVAPPLNRRTTP
jgi:hypothetical protein